MALPRRGVSNAKRQQKIVISPLGEGRLPGPLHLEKPSSLPPPLAGCGDPPPHGRPFPGSSPAGPPGVPVGLERGAAVRWAISRLHFFPFPARGTPPPDRLPMTPAAEWGLAGAAALLSLQDRAQAVQGRVAGRRAARLLPEQRALAAPSQPPPLLGRLSFRAEGRSRLPPSGQEPPPSDHPSAPPRDRSFADGNTC